MKRRFGSCNLALDVVYYYIGEKLGKFAVMHTIFMNDSIDKCRLSSKNVFISVTAAQEVLYKINKILEGHK